ncbi:hypothetical protein SCOR_25045 [Sulfidibacter corallicola]
MRKASKPKWPMQAVPANLHDAPLYMRAPPCSSLRNVGRAGQPPRRPSLHAGTPMLVASKRRPGRPTSTTPLSTCGHPHARRFETSAGPANLQPRRPSRHAGTANGVRFGSVRLEMETSCSTDTSCATPLREMRKRSRWPLRSKVPISAFRKPAWARRAVADDGSPSSGDPSTRSCWMRRRACR